MHVNLDNWFRCKVDKNIVKELSKKSDWKDILPVLIKQTSDPNYKIDVALPNK